MAGTEAAGYTRSMVQTRSVPPELSAQVYRQLRVLARARLRAGGRQTLLDTTALVHETYLRIAGVALNSVEERSFYAYASRTMRSVIVDLVRKRQAECRGGDMLIVTFTGELAERQPAAANDILRVHEALEELAGIDARLAQVVEMRYFAGLSEPEIARALCVSERTVRRDWEKARMLLSRALVN
ncbi:MAG: sigma-70 family RNA polymerase sigma factor [Chitinophagaceae bacterium]|nr:sigma-70 family RNA polymerase sigma factor [Rubrivivax sp.]